MGDELQVKGDEDEEHDGEDQFRLVPGKCEGLGHDVCDGALAHAFRPLRRGGAAAALVPAQQRRDLGLDAALLALPVEDEGFEVEILFEEPFMLATPASHPLSESENVSMCDLDGQELLLLEDGHCLRAQALEVCALAGAHERVDFHATSMETLRQMVAAEVGVTLMPVLSVKPPIPETHNLALRRFESPPPSRTIALVWRRSSPLGASSSRKCSCGRQHRGPAWQRPGEAAASRVHGPCCCQGPT